MGGLKTTYRIWILGGHHYIYIHTFFREMYVRMHACMYAHMHVRACVRACVRAWVCVCVTCSRRSPLPKAQCLLSHTVSCIYIRLIMTGDPLSVYIIYFSMAENHLEHLYGPHRDVLSVELLDALGETL